MQQQTTATTHTDTPPLDDWFTVDDLAAAFPRVLTVSALRWQLRHRDTNGLDASGAVRRCGIKLLISKSRFERWLASAKSGGA